MEIAFYLRQVISQGEKWTRTEGWPTAECVPRKGELVKVTVTANDGALVQREMRVVEVCHTGPRNVQVYLVPTYVKAASLQT
jgi:hypothetical protein